MDHQTIGLITYGYPHLKTEQVLLRILEKNLDYRIYALPFTPRKPRKPLIQHRPDQTAAAAPETLAAKFDLPYIACDSDHDIDSACDLYLILGAGILSPECVAGKRIVNAHPGVIPASRGLDSFKWAICEGKPLGNTLHYIDEEVDAGEVIAVVATQVFETDTIATLARRHYEAEIDLMTRFDEFIDHPRNDFPDIETGEARMRMPLDKERELESCLPDYLRKFS